MTRSGNMVNNSKTFRHRFPIWFDAKQKENDPHRFLIETDLQGYRLIQALLEHYAWQISADSVVKGMMIQKSTDDSGHDS